MQANKGEWSELYALLMIFANHKVPAADKNLNPTSAAYDFLRVVREDERNQVKFYDLTQEKSVVILDQTGQVQNVIPIDWLAGQLQKIFVKIKSAHEASFAVPEAEELMEVFGLKKIKANSSSKTDLVAIVKDQSAMHHQLGFSIKSQIGSPATLLNASRHTNFVYKIEGFRGNIEEVNNIDGNRKIRDRLIKIEDMGGSYVFSHIESELFTENLKIIDTLFSGILAEMLLHYYFGEGSTVRELSNLVGEANGYGISKCIVDYNVKEFLKAIALGMVPSKSWDTYMSAQGGYLIVKDDGQLVCYHLYNHDEFRDYLFDNTKFDTPSSSRHSFGKIYEQDGEYYIKLNLQIRFVK